jgi:hypothetical protein
MTSLTSQVTSLLLDVQSILIPEGQFLGHQVQVDEVHLCAFLLWEVCNYILVSVGPLTLDSPTLQVVCLLALH